MKNLKIGLVALILSLFYTVSTAQYLGPPSAYAKVTADTLSDTALFLVQTPGYLGGQSIKMRSITKAQLAIAVGGGSGCPTGGNCTFNSVTVDTLAVSTLLVSDTSSFKPKMTADTLNVTNRATFNYATASTDAVFDGNKRLVSNAVTGTGSSVRGTAPTIASPTFTGMVKTPEIGTSTTSERLLLYGGPTPYGNNATIGIYGSGLSRGEIGYVVGKSGATHDFYTPTTGLTYTLGSSLARTYVPAQFDGTVSVGGAATFQSTLAVTGASTFTAPPRLNGGNTTGGGSALLGTNSPAITNTAPYTWITIITSDGSTGYIPVWK